MHVSKKLRLRRAVDEMSVAVDERYDAQVREVCRLEAMTRWVRDREDFPVTSGDEIVACVIPTYSATKRRDAKAAVANNVRAFVYIPPGEHRLRYSFKEYWTERAMLGLNDVYGYGQKNQTGWERNAVTVDLPTGKLHEIVFSVEQDGERTMLRASVTGHHERDFPLPPCTVVRHEGFRYFNKTFPNQNLNELDESNRSGVMRRLEIKPNEVLYHGMTLKRRTDVQRPRGRSFPSGESRGQVRLYCWIESDVPSSVSVVAVAANGKAFIDQRRLTRPVVGGSIGMLEGPVPNVEKIFQPYDGSGNLYYDFDL